MITAPVFGPDVQPKTPDVPAQIVDLHFQRFDGAFRRIIRPKCIHKIVMREGAGMGTSKCAQKSGA